ncbi:MAG TPA: serine/threonine-protein kinase [Planctomycetota bacterium]|nr:serine/threonine-protein kinase [Planctomycetota bacterium]
MSEGDRERFPRIPGIQILEKLGAGGVGTVYLARHETLNRLVAVKILRRELAGNRLYVERLRREARLSARLDHPNVVKGLDLGEIEGLPYFVMEFVDGKSLKTVLRERGKLEEDEIVEVGLQIARALDHAYRHGVVHRDIKPGNVILARDGTVKVADLGLARRPDDASVTKDGTTLGTPHYVSPEQARDPVSADARSDLYSVGATLFHAATGSPPFDAETVGGVLAQVLDDATVAEVPPAADVGRNLALVLRRLLAKDPARRYQTPFDLIRDLERVRRNERPDVSVLAVDPRASRRLRTLLLVAGAAAIAIAATLFVWRSIERQRNDPARRAAAEAAAALARLEGEPASRPSEVTSRLRKVDDLLSGAALGDAERVRAVALRSDLASRLATGLSAFEAAATRDLDQALGARRLRDAWTLAESGLRERLREFLGGSPDELPPAEKERVDRFLAERRRAVERAVDAEEAALSQAVPERAAVVRAEIDREMQAGRYRSARAAASSATAVEGLTTPQGAAWTSLPELSRARVRARLDEALATEPARIREVAGVAARSLEDTLRREYSLREEALRAGRGSATPSYEDAAREALEQGRYVADEWPPEVKPDPGALAADLSRALRAVQQDAERVAAERVFADLAALLAEKLAAREYAAVGEQWRGRLERAALAPVRDRMERELRKSEDLVRLRERARGGLESRRGKRATLALRSGDGVTGRIASVAVEPDDVVVSLADPVGTVRFGALAAGEVEVLAAIGATPEDRRLRALLALADGDFDRAQAELVGLRSAGGSFGAEAERLLADVDEARAAAREAASARGRRLDETLRAARDLLRGGETALARERYEQARILARQLPADDPRIAALEVEIAQIDEAQAEAQRSRSLDALFPGAATRDLGGGRVEARWPFSSDRKFEGLELFEGWKSDGVGLVHAPRAGKPHDLARDRGARITLATGLRGDTSATFRVAVPFDAESAGAPSCSFGAFGRTALFTGSTAAFRSGGVAVPRATLGLLRGAVHEVKIETVGDGRGVSLLLDGVEVARTEEPAGGEPVFEVRAAGRLEWRELVVAGTPIPPRR